MADRPRMRHKVGAVTYVICGARNHSGDPCKLPAGYHTDHPGWGTCSRHYGNTQSQRKAAALQEVQETMLHQLGTQHPKISPEDALLGEVRRSAASVAYFDDVVSGITPDQLQDDDEGYKHRAMVQVWRAERKHLADVASLALRAGIEERLVRATEAQAEAVVRAMISVIRELGLSDEQQLGARRLLAVKLRELETAS